jgi:hypothetical protein
MHTVCDDFSTQSRYLELIEDAPLRSTSHLGEIATTLSLAGYLPFIHGLTKGILRFLIRAHSHFRLVSFLVKITLYTRAGYSLLSKIIIFHPQYG